MADVFISYSKLDKAIAEALANDLKAKGIDVWWDFDLYAGDDFHDVIMAELNNAKAVIVIWSANSAKSRYVRDEANEALKKNKLIPTLAPEATTDNVPLGFKSLQCVPVSSRDEVHRALSRCGVLAAAPGPSAAMPDPVFGYAPGPSWQPSSVVSREDMGIESHASDITLFMNRNALSNEDRTRARRIRDLVQMHDSSKAHVYYYEYVAHHAARLADLARSFGDRYCENAFAKLASKAKILEATHRSTQK